jgi:hypothetical protein
MNKLEPIPNQTIKCNRPSVKSLIPYSIVYNEQIEETVLLEFQNLINGIEIYQNFTDENPIVGSFAVTDAYPLSFKFVIKEDAQLGENTINLVYKNNTEDQIVTSYTFIVE